MHLRRQVRSGVIRERELFGDRYRLHLPHTIPSGEGFVEVMVKDEMDVGVGEEEEEKDEEEEGGGGVFLLCSDMYG